MLEPISATAPSAWTSYLINGDDSGLEPGNREAADSFVRDCLAGVAPCDCEPEGFAWNSDARRAGHAPYGADLERYTSLVESGHVQPSRA